MKQDDDLFAFEGLRFVESATKSMALKNDTRPSVIIASSGMAEGSRARLHIRNNIGHPKNTIVFVGYCDPNYLDGQLTAGASSVQLLGETINVAAEVEAIRSMSAHGDYEDLLHFLSCQDPALNMQLFLVHGEYEV